MSSYVQAALQYIQSTICENVNTIVHRNPVGHKCDTYDWWTVYSIYMCTEVDVHAYGHIAYTKYTCNILLMMNEKIRKGLCWLAFVPNTFVFICYKVAIKLL